MPGSSSRLPFGMVHVSHGAPPCCCSELAQVNGHGFVPERTYKKNVRSSQSEPHRHHSRKIHPTTPATTRTFPSPAPSPMLPVLDLHPILRPAALIWPVAALRHQSLQSLSQAARNRSGPISPCSNGATKMPSGHRANRSQSNGCSGSQRNRSAGHARPGRAYRRR